METNSDKIEALAKENAFLKEQNRRLMWIFGLTGGPAFLSKMETKKKDCPYPAHAEDCTCQGMGGDR